MKVDLCSEVKTSGNAVKIKFSGKVGRIALHGETESIFPTFGYHPLAHHITRIHRTNGYLTQRPIPLATRSAVLDWVDAQMKKVADEFTCEAQKALDREPFDSQACSRVSRRVHAVQPIPFPVRLDWSTFQRRRMAV